MKRYKSEFAFDIVNYAILAILAVTCLLPFVNVLAVSLSDSASATAGRVGLWPINANLIAYRHALAKPRFLQSMINTLVRVFAGVALNMALTVLTAYPLSKSKNDLKGRTFFSWFFVVTMLIGGGMVPSFLIVVWTGLKNTIWSLILPGALPVFNMVILLNFFRQLPHELEESAVLDGAGDFTILLRIYLPLSVPCLATLIVFQTVAHWNDWYSGSVYLDEVTKFPLATYLHNVLQMPNFDTLSSMSSDQVIQALKLSPRTLTNAQIVLSTIPVVMVYPFLQRFFVKGMTLGSLKG